MRYHLFQKFFGKMVEIKERSFLSTRGAVCFALNCMSFYSRKYLSYENEVHLKASNRSEQIVEKGQKHINVVFGWPLMIFGTIF